jgi:hypothetical protein
LYPKAKIHMKKVYLSLRIPKTFSVSQNLAVAAAAADQAVEIAALVAVVRLHPSTQPHVLPLARHSLDPQLVQSSKSH